MSGFFKSLFRGQVKRQALSSPRPGLEITDESLAGLPLEKLVSILKNIATKTLPYSSLKAIIDRCYRIALFDNHVSAEVRGKAMKLADAATEDLKIMLVGDDEALVALTKIKDHMQDLARQGGVGSLMWRLTEYSISAADNIPYIMRPEHRHLIPDYLEALPQVLEQHKQTLVRELVLQSNYKSFNSVMILHGLVATADKAVSTIFSSQEYMALRNVPGDYARGRDVLVGLGILPAISNAPPFRELQELSGGIVSTLGQLFNERRRSAEADRRLELIPEGKRVLMLLSLALLRVELARGVIYQIHGKAADYDIITMFGDAGLVEHLELFKNVMQVLKNVPVGLPLDLAFLDVLMGFDGSAVMGEEEFNRNHEFFGTAVRWLNTERVEFLDALRWRLRGVSEWEAEKSSAIGWKEDGIGRDG